MPAANDPDIAPPLRHVIIGTAGHIDHGKTSLIRCLTGIDTDRLPEEKARGISIDLGFAHWETDDVRFGVVDVPGHERFVRNMVAGATGIDLALLVVAADDSVMPQTSEHLEIMDLLGIPTGVVAISKIDLVEPELVSLVEADVAERLAGTFLEGCPIVPISSKTGAGIDRLRESLVAAARRRRPAGRIELFRMPIDRVFTIAGHGTVVTGSVLGGDVRPGDMLELFPEQRVLRVRGVQVHGREVDGSGSGTRTAINLAGTKVDELRRGQELAAPGFLQPTRRLLVRAQCLSSSPVPLRDRMEVQLHLGTGETSARVAMPGGTILPGSHGHAELRTAEPIVAAFGQRFILRRPSPALTIGGGVVLDPAVEARRRLPESIRRAGALETADELERLSLFCAERDDASWTPAAAAWKIGVAPASFPDMLRELTAQGWLLPIRAGEKGRLVHRARLQELRKDVLKKIRAALQAQRPRHALPRPVLVSACRNAGPQELVEAAFEALIASGELVAVGPNYGPADMQVQLTKNQAATREKILQRIAAAGLMPPTQRELAEELGQPPAPIGELLALCVEERLLVAVEVGLYYPPAALEKAREICREALRSLGSATMSQLREAWGVTRKYSLPLSQYFDARQVTVREGDLRRAGPRIDQPLSFD